jgi:hypothetical protein
MVSLCGSDGSDWAKAGGFAVGLLALAALHAGEFDVADAAATASLAELERSGRPTASRRLLLAQIKTACGDGGLGLDLARQALAGRAELWRPNARLTLASTLARAGAATRPERTAELLGVVDAEQARLGYVWNSWTIESLDAARAVASRGLSENAFSTAYERGRGVEIAAALDREETEAEA